MNNCKDCRKRARDGSNYCHGCSKKKYRKKYPLKACYQNLKANSRRRGKTFTITFEEFLSVIDGTGFVDNHGRFANNLSIDRKNNNTGYEGGNLQVLTVSANAAKHIHNWPEEPPF